jgi:alpha/beta superfamily hydrolase
MRQSAVTFKAKGLNFEGVMATPDDAGGKVPGVVICHPHPLFGGNMDNNVVLAVAYGLAQQGIATLRFNFRGVGNSEGEHTKGEQEHHEALAAIDLLQAWPDVDEKRIGLAGYSFGTRVVCSHSELHKAPKVFALISPSYEALETAALKKNKQPKLVITGDRDKLIQAENLQPVLDSFATPPTFKLVPGVDHFWFGKEDLLVDEVSPFFCENLA